MGRPLLLRGARRPAGAAIAVALLVALSGGLAITADAGAASPAPFVFTTALPNPTVLPTGRVFAAGATMPDGAQSVLTGGQSPGGANLADTWTFTTAAGWAPRCGTTTPATDPCPVGARIGAGAGTAPGGVLVYGGFPESIGDSPLEDAWQWDGTQWQRACDECGPGPRGLMAMAGNGTQVVLFGGLGESGGLEDTWVFDGTDWTQTCGPGARPGIPMCGLTARLGASMAWDGTQFVLFGGGDPGADATPLDDTYTFDGTSWTKVCGTSAVGAACGPPGREVAAFSFAPHPDPALQGAFLAQGGDLFGGGESGGTQSLLRDAWFWHAGTWSRLAAPWDGPPATWTSEDDGPPPGDYPLIGTAMARPDECQVLYAAAGVGVASLVPYGYLGGRDLTGAGTPSPCTVTPVTTTTTTAVAAGTTTAATIANTGPGATARRLLIGLGCLAVGGTCVVGARRRARRLRAECT
jgi:hypothetical protein